MGDTRLEPLVMSDAERRILQGWSARRKTAQGLALRARIVLACAEGRSNTAVAARLRVSRTTVRKWRWPASGRQVDRGVAGPPPPCARRHRRVPKEWRGGGRPDEGANGVAA